MEEEGKNEKRRQGDGDSVSCGHGPSGRTIFYYRIHLSSLLNERVTRVEVAGPFD